VKRLARTTASSHHRVRTLACAWLALAGVAATATEPPASQASAQAEIPEEPADYWTGPINGPVPKTLSGGTVVGTTELQALLGRSDIVLVEVSNAPRRPESLAPGAPWLPKPHVVIPGSLWIPGAGMGEIAHDVDTAFRDQLARATAGDLDRQIVVYCHERCWLSWNAAKRAIRYGYRSVHWYPDGIEGWRAAGLETAVSAEPPS
jgi:PQQ-dependent catabolism-associated CXXCW motif protein